MRIGIDIDDTICSTTKELIKYQNKFLSEYNIYEDELWKYYKDVFLERNLEKIYNNAKIKDNAKEIINKLKEKKHEIYIITARSEKCLSDIYKTINNYLDKYNIQVDKIIINSKDKVCDCRKHNIDIMIDDSIYNYNKLKNNGVKVILFDDENKYVDIANRVSSWNEVLDKVNILKECD